MRREENDELVKLVFASISELVCDLGAFLSFFFVPLFLLTDMTILLPFPARFPLPNTSGGIFCSLNCSSRISASVNGTPPESRLDFFGSTGDACRAATAFAYFFAFSLSFSFSAAVSSP